MTRTCYLVLLLGTTPRRSVLEDMLDVLGEVNRAWYLDQWRRGFDPPRSARDAGVIWQPDQPDTRAIFADAPTVFGVGVASCGPIAAIDVGYLRARAELDGHGRVSTRERFRVVLRPQSRDEWHAFVSRDGVLEDPTRGMQR